MTDQEEICKQPSPLYINDAIMFGIFTFALVFITGKYNK